MQNNDKWYTLYIKPRHEKFVEAELKKKGIDAFTPKVKIKKRWSDRTKYIEEPIFKSYCFAKFNLQARTKVFSKKGVLVVVNFNRNYLPLEDSVIQSLKILIENDLKIDPYPYLKIGERISIRKGSLKGFEGHILEKGNNSAMLVVSVEAIASSVKCVVDANFVDKI